MKRNILLNITIILCLALFTALAGCGPGKAAVEPDSGNDQPAQDSGNVSGGDTSPADGSDPTGSTAGDTANPQQPGGVQAPSQPPPMTVSCEHTGSGTLYEVGPGLAYPTIGSVPWETLGAGDTVRIHWKSDPYREKIFISNSGTAAEPVHICGLPGPAGELPIIDGQNATTRPELDFTADILQDYGLIVFYIGPTDDWDTYRPSHIVIEGLSLRGANSSNTYTDTHGAVRSYVDGAGCITVRRGEYITIRGCEITQCGNGLFTFSLPDNDATITRHFLIEGNSIYGNGSDGSYLRHNIYTQSSDVVFQFNFIGRLRAGSGGVALKDRSAGTVIRYNWIEGGARSLDLVEAEDSYPYTSLEPNYDKAFVYGNVIRNLPPDHTLADNNANMIHYGGDNDVVVLPSGERSCATCRKGTLFFYNNTVFIEADQTGVDSRWRTSIFDLSTNDETLDARNNIFFVKSVTPGATPSYLEIMREAGVANLYANWINAGWLDSPADEPGSTHQFIGTVNVMDPILLIEGDDPGFTDAAALNLIPAAASPCVGAAGALAAGVLPDYDVLYEYEKDASGVARASHDDLGAFEHH